MFASRSLHGTLGSGGPDISSVELSVNTCHRPTRGQGMHLSPQSAYTAPWLMHPPSMQPFIRSLSLFCTGDSSHLAHYDASTNTKSACPKWCHVDTSYDDKDPPPRTRNNVRSAHLAMFFVKTVSSVPPNTPSTLRHGWPTGGGNILSLNRTFLLGFIILGNAPKIAPLRTHDILNRIVGQMTMTLSARKWLVKSPNAAEKSQNVPRPTSLAAAIFLLLIYTALVALSDIGLIGFHQCNAPIPPYSDFAASIRSDADALQVIKRNLINGTSPSSVPSLRCDHTEIETLAPNITFSGCTSWQNSSYADSSAFLELNSTDSNVLMPRRLANLPTAYKIYTNSYVARIEGPGLKSAVIRDGFAIEPHLTGVRAVIGVPELSPNQTVWIPKTMAIEADVGCMALGITAQKDTITDDVVGFFQTRGQWREYAARGPNYFRDVLSKYVDLTRARYKPLYNDGITASDGSLRDTSGNSYNRPFYTQDIIGYASFSQNVSADSDWQNLDVQRNCTEELQTQLGVLVPDSRRLGSSQACGFFQISTSVTSESPIPQMTKMLCASATQVNMVSVTVQKSPAGTVFFTNLTRIPSTLNIVDADYWAVYKNTTYMGQNNVTIYDSAEGLLRFTLSDNPSGPSNHPIYQRTYLFSNGFRVGTGSAGLTISELGSRMLTILTDDEVLGLLNDDALVKVSVLERTTRWAGGIGGSFLLGSIGFNGWAARSQNSPRPVIHNVWGEEATCYQTVYGLAFLPLLLALVVLWAAGIVLGIGRGSDLLARLRAMYGGLNPYVTALPGEEPLPETMLVWEQNGKSPYLKLASNGRPDDDRIGGTLAGSMKDG